MKFNKKIYYLDNVCPNWTHSFCCFKKDNREIKINNNILLANHKLNNLI